MFVVCFLLYVFLCFDFVSICSNRIFYFVFSEPWIYVIHKAPPKPKSLRAWRRQASRRATSTNTSLYLSKRIPCFHLGQLVLVVCIVGGVSGGPPRHVFWWYVATGLATTAHIDSSWTDKVKETDFDVSVYLHRSLWGETRKLYL